MAPYAEHEPKSLSATDWLSLGCLGASLSTAGLFLLGAIIFFAVLFGLSGEIAQTDTGTGEVIVSDRIPEQLRPIFAKASQKHDVSVNLIAAIFAHGEHCETPGGTTTCDKPSFQLSGPWKSNETTNASGPFQFLECSWEGWNQNCSAYGKVDSVFSTDLTFIRNHGGMGQDCDDDGRADVQNLWDASCAAAIHLRTARGVYDDSPASLAKIRKAAFSYNHASWYAERVVNGYVSLLRSEG